MIFSPLLVWCDLAGPLAGDAPHLDGLLTNRLALLSGQWRKIGRGEPAPEPGSLQIPIKHSRIGGQLVYHVSAPILGQVLAENVEHYHQRFPTDRADWLEPGERTQVPKTMTWTKSYRLPNRVRVIDRICWIVEGNWHEMRKLLKGVTSIGKDRSQGYGAVKVEGDVLAWGHEEAGHLDGCWWYASHDAGPALMRPLPWGDWLPDGLIGWRRDFGACAPPYWHRDRYCELVTPC